MKEKLIGMGPRIIDGPAPKGMLKENPEDFKVEEIPVPITREEDGRYTIFRATLNNWDTNRFVIAVADHFRISRERITYAGTKDRKGITTQYFCIDGAFDPASITYRGVEIADVFRSDTRLELGMLSGNHFTVNVFPQASMKDLLFRKEELDGKGGFPNYFGWQRFGSIRVNTHRIGELLVRGRYEDAVNLYLYDPLFDTEDYRKNYGETGDAKTALKEYPLHLRFERSLLGYIVEHQRIEGAFDVFPRYLKMIFIHSFQSYLFNTMLTERIKTMGSLNRSLPGDTVTEVDELFNRVGDPVTVNSFNLEKIQDLIGQNRMRPMMKLFGFNTEFSSGLLGELERNVLGDIRQNQFRIKGHRDMWSSGDLRIISAVPHNFQIDDSLVMGFDLGKGMYATSFLRELVDFPW